MFCSKAQVASQEGSQSTDSHRNEGFLKSAWHKLTQQHGNLPPEVPEEPAKGDDKVREEEPKKAAGSS